MLFTVRGQGRFPVDMLRYDRCHPSTEADSRAIATHEYGRDREVDVAVDETNNRSGTPARKPTTARWESFGWQVVALNGERVAA